MGQLYSLRLDKPPATEQQLESQNISWDLLSGQDLTLKGESVSSFLSRNLYFPMTSGPSKSQTSLRGFQFSFLFLKQWQPLLMNFFIKRGGKCRKEGVFLTLGGGSSSSQLQEHRHSFPSWEPSPLLLNRRKISSSLRGTLTISTWKIEGGSHKGREWWQTGGRGEGRGQVEQSRARNPSPHSTACPSDGEHLQK